MACWALLLTWLILCVSDMEKLRIDLSCHIRMQDLMDDNDAAAAAPDKRLAEKPGTVLTEQDSDSPAHMAVVDFVAAVSQDSVSAEEDASTVRESIAAADEDDAVLIVMEDASAAEEVSTVMDEQSSESVAEEIFSLNLLSQPSESVAEEIFSVNAGAMAYPLVNTPLLPEDDSTHDLALKTAAPTTAEHMDTAETPTAAMALSASVRHTDTQPLGALSALAHAEARRLVDEVRITLACLQLDDMLMHMPSCSCTMGTARGTLSLSMKA